MKTTFAAVLVGMMVLGLMSSAPSKAQTNQPAVVKVLAQASSWKFSGVELRRGQVAEIKATGTWFINPLWARQYGAGGHPELNAKSEYALEGAHEGCLLVAVGEKVVAFTKDREALKISGPGKIALIANDAPGAKNDATVIGAVKIAGIPVDGTAKIRAGGYADNGGALRVTISVREGR